jgi:hypothetical protein
MNNPELTLSLTASIEWSTDWMALLLGVAAPYGTRRDGIGAEPWILSVGASFSPF